MNNPTLENVTDQPRGEPVRGEAGRELPLLVGVTGHRDLRREKEDVKRLEKEVGEVLDEINQRMPNTPIIIVSALAEGADRLVARVGVKRGCRLVAPLPMPPEIYKKNFKDDESRVEFDELLKQADPWFELSEGRVENPDGDRETCYELVGAYLAQSCQVLIALWDGVDSGKRGGSSAVIKYALEGVPADLDLLLNGAGVPRAGDLDEPDGCVVVHHIYTPRVSGQPPVDPLPESKRLFPKSKLPEERVKERFTRIAIYLDHFNTELKGFGDHSPVDSKKGAGLLGSKAEEDALPGNLRRLREQYALTDALAIDFQKRTTRAQDRLLVFTWLAIGAFALYSSVAGIPPFWSAALLLIFLAYLAWLLFAGRDADRPALARLCRFLRLDRLFRFLLDDPQREFLDYRALTEALRVQFYWSLTSLPDRVEDHYLRQHRTELDWIRVTLRVARLLRDNFQIARPVNSASIPPERLQQARANWVEGQGSYFAETANRDKAKMAKINRQIRWLLWLTSAATSALLFWLIASNKEPVEPYRGALILVAVLAPAAAGLFKYQMDREAVSEQKKRYERMSILHQIAADRLKDRINANQADEARRLLRLIGQEALAENANWVMLRRDRPVSAP